MQDVVHDEYRRHGADHWWIEGRRRIFARLLDRWDGLPPAAHILDIGPGSGVNLPVLARHGTVTVVDVDIGSLRSCRRAGAHHLVAGDATSPPLQDRSFDLVCALDVLEHLDDDRAALGAIHDLLRPGGRALLSVPALGLLWGRQDVLSGHRRRYSRKELGRRVRAAGLTIERLSYFNTWLFPPILLVRLAMRPFLSKAPKGSDLAMPRAGLNGLLTRVFASEARCLSAFDLPIGVSLLCLAHRPEDT